MRKISFSNCFFSRIFASRKSFFFIAILLPLIYMYMYYIVSNNFTILKYDSKLAVLWLIFNLVTILALVTFITIKFFKLWSSHTLSINSIKLQSKIILLFSLIASIPTIIITISSAVFFNYGIQSWFDNKVNSAFRESVEVANAYLEEHKKLIEADTRGMEENLNSLFNELNINPHNFSMYLSKQAYDRSFTEAIVFEINPFHIIAKSNFSFPINLDDLPNNAISMAKNNIVIIEESDKIRGLVELNYNHKKTFLLVGRLVDKQVSQYVQRTKHSYNEYIALNNNLANIQIKFSQAFIAISLILALSAIWIGLKLSSAIIKPISNLLNATAEIKEGNFDVYVSDNTEQNEIAHLSKAFNLMTQQLRIQRQELIDINKQNVERKEFIEAVISSVSAGIIVVDINKKITIINPQAEKILHLNKKYTIGDDFRDICPEMYKMLSSFSISENKAFCSQSKIIRGGKTINIITTITKEISCGHIFGYIITFDDITELVTAQRNAAWSDIARRIAHEIKNPLTPIHLATQRLNKKYANEVNDPQNFTKYIDTIIKQVNQIGKMVEEFVSFARMPNPKIVKTNINQIIQDVIFLRECLDNGIEYNHKYDQYHIDVDIDIDQIYRLLTNLIKNAEESIVTVKPKKGIITIVILQKNNKVIMELTDNGNGIPSNIFNYITEPYVTQKSKGTGLGLAIVKKIVDDHNGNIKFLNIKTGGAKVIVSLPITQ